LRSGAAPWPDARQPFIWRRRAREEPPVDKEASAQPLFAPAVMEAPTDARPKKRRRRGGRPSIELEVDGVMVRVRHGARAKTIAAVIRALKAGK
jgi:transposase